MCVCVLHCHVIAALCLLLYLVLTRSPRGVVVSGRIILLSQKAPTELCLVKLKEVWTEAHSFYKERRDTISFYYTQQARKLYYRTLIWVLLRR